MRLGGEVNFQTETYINKNEQTDANLMHLAGKETRLATEGSESSIVGKTENRQQNPATPHHFLCTFYNLVG